MKKVLVTGSAGFIGRNLIQALERRGDVNVSTFDVLNNPSELALFLGEADIIYHLAGVNRPPNNEDYEAGNAGITRDLVGRLEELDRIPVVVFFSSVQANMDNPYGQSKLHAEEALESWSARRGATVILLRLPNVFGKWCRPNYNSAVATFCHNISRGLDISVSDRSRELELVYVDDVVATCMDFLDYPPKGGSQFYEVSPTFRVNLGQIVDMLYAFKSSRQTLAIPDFSDPLIKRLYATYVSYLSERELDYALGIKRDERGILVEFLKSPAFGQLFVSKTKPGAIRGNHYHNTKVEKFFVLEGEALVRLRNGQHKEEISLHLSGRNPRVVDIPPGYSHSIQNVGGSEMIVLFWASEPFNSSRPDTYSFEVAHE